MTSWRPPCCRRGGWLSCSDRPCFPRTPTTSWFPRRHRSTPPSMPFGRGCCKVSAVNEENWAHPEPFARGLGDVIIGHATCDKRSLEGAWRGRHSEPQSIHSRNSPY